MVREEAAKAHQTVTQWGLDDIAAGRETWRKNGGEVVDLTAGEVTKYKDAVTSVVPPLLAAASPTVKAAYEKVQAAATLLAQ